MNYLKLTAFTFNCIDTTAAWKKLRFILSVRSDFPMHYLDANKTAGKEARRQLRKNVASNIEQVLATTPHKAPTIRPLASHHENYPS